MNNSIVQAYLNFDGNCDDALAFYKQALGAEIQMLMRFKDSPDPPPPGCPPPNPGKVMHAQFRVGDTVLLASDGRGSGSFALA
jgi:PhnB protein